MISFLCMKTKRQRKIKELIRVTQLVSVRSGIQIQILLTLKVILLTPHCSLTTYSDIRVPYSISGNSVLVSSENRSLPQGKIKSLQHCFSSVSPLLIPTLPSLALLCNPKSITVLGKQKVPPILVHLIDVLLVFHPTLIVLVLGSLLCILKHGSCCSSDSLPFAWQAVIHPLGARLHPLPHRRKMLHPLSSLPKWCKSKGENLGELFKQSPLIGPLNGQPTLELL